MKKQGKTNCIDALPRQDHLIRRFIPEKCVENIRFCCDAQMSEFLEIGKRVYQRMDDRHVIAPGGANLERHRVIHGDSTQTSSENFGVRRKTRRAWPRARETERQPAAQISDE